MRLAKITLAIMAVLILIGFTTLALRSGVTGQELDFQVPKLQSTEAKLKDINIQYEKLNGELSKQSSSDKQKIQELNEQKQQLVRQRDQLKQKADAKAEEKAKLQQVAEATASKVTGTASASADTISAPVYSGSHEDWMAAAGISPSDYGYVDYIISHESGWCATKWEGEYGYCPGVVEDHYGLGLDVDFSLTYKGYGVCQSTPGNKMAIAGSDWQTNPVTQLKWCTMHAAQFGGWAGAYYHWLSHNNW